MCTFNAKLGVYVKLLILLLLLFFFRYDRIENIALDTTSGKQAKGTGNGQSKLILFRNIFLLLLFTGNK